MHKQRTTINMQQLSGILCLCVLHTALRCAVVPADTPELLRPPAKLLDEASLQDAMRASVHSGALFILEEMLAPGNDTALFYPPHAALKKIDEKIVERRYRKDKDPIYEKKKVQRLVPKRDEYGGIIGYEKKWVEVRASDKIIGYRDVEVPDPNGDIIKQITVPIFDRSNRMLPRGWFGMNAQAILLLSRCGLGNSNEVRKCASELERYMNSFGMPDATWDLAWMCMAWITLSEHDESRSDRRDRLIGRLIDGSVTSGGRKNPALCLWGPVSINHEAQAKLFRIELELQTLFAETEAALENAPKNKKKKLQEEFQKISAALGEVKRANRYISQQGRRLSSIERPWKMDEENKQTGISYYTYNRTITDIDSTAITAMALAIAKQKNLLPEQTPRDTIRGKILAAPLDTEDIIETAYKSLYGLAPEQGDFNSLALLLPIDAYDKVPNLAGVPLAVKLPELLRPETWHSNASALSAMFYMDQLVDERSRERMRDRPEIIAANRNRVLSIIDAWLKSEPLAQEWQGPHADEVDTLAGLKKNDGWPLPPEEKKRKKDSITPVDQLSVGHLRSPRALLEHLMPLHRSDESVLHDAASRLCYRLLIEQQPDGSWLPQTPVRFGSPSISSGEWSYLIGKLAKRHLWQAEEDAKNKHDDPVTTDFLRDGPYIIRVRDQKRKTFKHIYSVVFEGEGNAPRTWGYPTPDFYTVDMRLTETLSALLFLSGGLKEHPLIDKQIVTDIMKRSQLAKAAFEKALQDLQESDLDEKAKAAAQKKLESAGPEMVSSDKQHHQLLHELWRRILLGSGLNEKLSIIDALTEEAAPPEEAEAGAETDAADAETATEKKEDSPTDKLDDILGGDE